MKVSVIGAGKMGLPLACVFASRGAQVWACDRNRSLVEAINAAEAPFDEPGVAPLLAAARAAGTLEATTDTKDAVAESDAVVVIVPAVIQDDRTADLGILLEVTDEIAAARRPGVLVSYETTVPVGTTRDVFHPRLEGAPLHLAFSPERVKSGLMLDRLTNTPKVVGGLDPESAAAASDFYARYLGAPVMNVGSLEAAEFVKLAGMLYRDANIALSNELARYAEAAGIDFPELIDTINTNGEAHLLLPGIGVGGHCTPVYPYFLIGDAASRGVPMQLAGHARAINDGQAEWAVARLERAAGPLAGARVAVLGLAFRPGVKEHLYSPAFLLAPALAARGAEVVVHDPLYSDEEIRRLGLTPGPVEGAAIAVLNTAHREYASLDFPALAAAGLHTVLDGRNLWDPADVAAAGVAYLAVGRP